MASTSIGDIVSHVQRELDDPAGKAYTASVVLPDIKQAFRDLMADMTSLDLSYDDDVVELSNVPADTPSLSTYQASGGALANMVEPISIEWKQVGEPDENYRPVKRVDKVKDAPASEQGIESWEWRKGIVYLSLSSIPVDMRIKGDFAPNLPTDVSDTVQFNIASAVGYLAASKIAYRRGLRSASGESLGQVLAAQYERSKDNLEVQVVKGEQTVLRKWGRNVVKQKQRARWLPPLV